MISKAELGGIGEAGIALVSKENSESPGKGRTSLGSIARRMSQKLHISSSSSRESSFSGRNSEPVIHQVPEFAPISSEGSAAAARPRGTSDGPRIAQGTAASGSRGQSLIVPPSHHVINNNIPSRSPPGFRPNLFLQDNLVKYTGEFRVTVNNFGLGLDLLEATSHTRTIQAHRL